MSGLWVGFLQQGLKHNYENPHNLKVISVKTRYFRGPFETRAEALKRIYRNGIDAEIYNFT
jgi:hypothetical protein